MGRAGGGRVSSGRSSARRTGGGHSAGRVGGGHRIGSSSHGGSRVGMSPPPPRGRGPGMPPPPPRNHGPRMPHFYRRRRYGGYSGYHGMGCGGCLTSVIVLAVIIICAIVAAGRSIPIRQKQTPSVSSSNSQETTPAREKLATDYNYINDCIIDELGWFDDISKTEKQLKNFWEKTGVQPYIILRDYDASLTSDSEKEQWAIDYYDNNFDAENIFLFVYFAEEDTDNDVGYMAYANGYETTSVMDSEAVEIFWNNIDKYWYTDWSTDDVFIQTFNNTADRIM